MPRSNDPTTPLLVQDALLDDTGKLGIVRATFEGFEKSSFEDLISGYSSLKVLTYSSSVPIISRAAEKMENLEVVFGRADILGDGLISLSRRVGGGHRAVAGAARRDGPGRG
jgi:hypothetical protein